MSFSNKLKDIISPNKIFTSLISIKKQILISFSFYFIGIIVGMFLSRNQEYTTNPQNLKFAYIFFNNYRLSILIIIIGLITVGIGSSIMLFTNGVILGDILIGVFNKYSVWPILTGVAPHFIFEISALCIATSISYESIRFIRLLLDKNYTNKVHIGRILSNFVTMTVLFFVAALIETNIAHI
ncbi:hypothetical protein CBE01nite_25740 [Clostridium beijerinckii]|uniref:Stage II sporulation protein M n=1 Tax=Clostridium beijerinckii TaxID=1520 RepID=A0AB74VQ48_CLOBE|nr:hypothetical protein CLBEI_33040 [Clostridium beijerinckii]QUN37925.1 stage II sporulation protein M [Clostridium beijerinckii]GEP64806.1 hypothetical protein CBE01nite_25740 [Clostridium beijerinckii]SQB12025.1 Integral membrane protein DUF95 [Clostridium beijerinckii]